jgi:Leucine-rich repeat (LRR) protein
LTSYSKATTPTADNGLALDEGGRMTHRILNGFTLLDASGVGLPEDSIAAVLVEKGLVDVNEEDLPFFTGLEYLDVSENSLNIAAFQSLSSLVELRLACNNIYNIGDLYGFESLQRLDLSYNKLTVLSVQALQALPNLKELDLCGNDIKGLPIDMFRFSSLEKILLEHNKMDDNNIEVIEAGEIEVSIVSLTHWVLLHK